jgi:hypothetical protein
VPRDNGTWNRTTITVLRMSTTATSTSGAGVVGDPERHAHLADAELHANTALSAVRAR